MYLLLYVLMFFDLAIDILRGEPHRPTTVQVCDKKVGQGIDECRHRVARQAELAVVNSVYPFARRRSRSARENASYRAGKLR